MRRRKATPRNFFKPLNSKRLDFRYIYLLFAWKDFSFKIGIARDAKKRRKDIDDDLKGRVTTIAKGEVLRARKYERYLHKKFESDRFKQNGDRNAGNTEYFRLSPFEALQVCFLIKWRSKWRWLAVAVLIILVIGLNL